MTSKLRDYINETMNDNRIFSYEDVIAMDNEEGRYYQKVLDEQYSKIGFPNNKELSNSGGVVYVHEYTRDDGTVVKAHYRSKAGQGDPNKVVMQSLGEYKTEIEKEIDKFMTQDAYNRYGENAIIGNKQKTETEENEQQDNIDYAAFYPGGTATQQLSESDDLQNAFSVDEINLPEEKYSSREKLLTGGIEISRDLDNEIPAVEYRKESNREIPPKKQQEAKYSPNYKPYTGREMNLSAYNPSGYEWQRYLDKDVIKNRFSHIVKNTKDDVLKNLKQGFNKVAYPVLASEPGYKLQKNASQNEYISSKIEKRKYPNATKYYRIAATHGMSIIRGTDSDNLLYGLGNMPDIALKRHIENIFQGEVNSRTMVVEPKEDSRLMNDVKKSKTVIDALKHHPNEKIINLDFAEEDDLSKTIGHAHIYRPYRDKDGNTVVTIVDYYDYADSKEKTFAGALVKNAYRQQEEGELTNYIFIMKIKYTPSEWQPIINE